MRPPSKYLLALGILAKAAELVEAHVFAKRYLFTTEYSSHDKLSDATKESLRFQGGLMSQKEVQGWQEGRGSSKGKPEKVG
jgi:predicted HD phosphohydrolase